MFSCPVIKFACPLAIYRCIYVWNDHALWGESADGRWGSVQLKEQMFWLELPLPWLSKSLSPFAVPLQTVCPAITVCCTDDSTTNVILVPLQQWFSLGRHQWYSEGSWRPHVDNTRGVCYITFLIVALCKIFFWYTFWSLEIYVSTFQTREAWGHP